MGSTLFESTPPETEPTLLPDSIDNFQLSFQMIMSTTFVALGVPFNVVAIFFLWRKCDGSLCPIVPFLLNLAAADLLVLTIFIPFYMAYEAMGFEWTFGSFLCKGVFSLTHICMYVSLATLATIAVERYLITFYHSIRQRVIKFVIIVVWVIAILLSIPQLLYLNTIDVNFLEDMGEEEFLYGDEEAMEPVEGKYICEIVWPHPNYERILHPIDAVVLYLVPLTFIFVIYVRIIVKLREIDSKQLPPARLCFVKQRKRAVRKMITVIVIFALCHLPIHVFHLLRVFYFDFWEAIVTEYPWVFSMSVNLVLATHVVNPLVYGSLHRCFLSCAEFWNYLNCRYLFSPAKGFTRASLIRRSNTRQTITKNRPSFP